MYCIATIAHFRLSHNLLIDLDQCYDILLLLFSKHVFPFTLICSKQYFFPCTKYIGILFL